MDITEDQAEDELKAIEEESLEVTENNVDQAQVP